MLSSGGHQLSRSQDSLGRCMEGDNQLLSADTERSDSRVSIIELTKVTVCLQSILYLL